MDAPQYAELHCHSSFSLLDGASNPEDLVEQANKLGLAALAITDHDDMGGAIRFAQVAAATGLPGLIGCELTTSDDHHLILLAKNLEGYKNICRLITGARMKNQRGWPRTPLEELDAHSQGLVALSGCPKGRVPYLIAAGNLSEARKTAGHLAEIFKGDFFLELWNHETAQESLICRELLDLSASLDLPYVITNNVHYTVPEKSIVHDVLTCLRHEVTLSTAGRRLRPNNNWHLKSAQQMAHHWRHYEEGLKNTLEIAARCQFRLGLLKPALPEIDISHRLQTIAQPGEKPSANQILTRLAWQGAAQRYGDRLTDKHRAQLEHELDLITRLDLAPYFLIMWDIVCFAASRGIAVQGRGSAANSVVCYCLKITAVDPVAADLLFERFISEERNEPPDIDLDIAHQEREHVLQYVYQKYGRAHAAMVCEHITYRGPSAVRDTARVFDFSVEQADALSAQSNFHEAAEAAAGLAAGGAARAGLDANDLRVKKLIEVVAGLDRLPRHRSIHVGGFVLAGEPVGGIVPVEPASMDGRTVIQWDKDDIDYAGLVKIDLLGLGMLTMLSEAVKLIKAQRGIDLDFSQLPTDDPAIYQMLTAADTVGVFQVESRAQMSILPKIRPKCFYDIVISIAIVRPGPIQGNIVHPYLRRRRGIEPVTYLHPSIEPILKRTLGVPLFQEQGMRLAVVAANFTASQADQLRRVMSHKRSMEKMIQVCNQLAAGMRKNGFSEEAIETITFQLKAFANYGFPESHAASFALLVYASAYIKLYFAPEFYCAILNAQPMGFYSPATLIRDAARHNVEVKPPDIAKSSWDCTLEKDHCNNVVLRVGLRYVGGLGPKAKILLQKAWRTGGPFTSVEDVITRSGLSQADLKRLAHSGAFETLAPGRRSAMWKVLKLSRRRPTPLLDLLNNPDTVELPPMSAIEETVADYSILGLSCGQHPMTYFRKWAAKQGMIECAKLPSKSHGQQITVAGSVICRQRPGTAKGFVFLTVEDETGNANVIVRPSVFEEYRKVLLSHNFLAITGGLQLEEGVINVIADSIEALPTLNNQGEIPMVSRDFH